MNDPHPVWWLERTVYGLKSSANVGNSKAKKTINAHKRHILYDVPCILNGDDYDSDNDDDADDDDNNDAA